MTRLRIPESAGLWLGCLNQNHCSSRRESAHSFSDWFQWQEHIAKFERTHVRCYRSEWWPRNLSGVWSERGQINFPELRPEIFLQRMHCRITGNNRAAKLPSFGMLNQAVLPRVVDDVKA